MLTVDDYASLLTMIVEFDVFSLMSAINGRRVIPVITMKASHARTVIDKH